MSIFMQKNITSSLLLAIERFLNKYKFDNFGLMRKGGVTFFWHAYTYTYYQYSCQKIGPKHFHKGDPILIRNVLIDYSNVI